ncbi:Sensor histidine kinase [Labilithrix luteola]|uniref:histidine kinase n=1 Tax=Labilithrix luteola TaxID=1391654 RepID=A0A0K1PTI5_9BACT|nr:HAMP domain-containing sensor histidine kinase [Labilithrix luteola]AKU96444.1 Sensor histidine kinase [Labilithrix luteola]
MTATATRIPPAAPDGGAPRKSHLHPALNERTAIPIALVLTALMALGDYATGADVTFTLLYLVPIGVAAWLRGRAFSWSICVLCTLSYLATAYFSPPRMPHPGFIVWNLFTQAGVFFAFAAVLHALRSKVDDEIQQRESAVGQLRHAERLTTVGKLASGIAHELGTPLNVVAGRAALIASKRIEGDDARKSAEVIVAQTERMTAIIRHLLDFARRGGTRKTVVDLNRLVHETTSMIEPLATKHSARLQIEASTTVVASVNASEMQQVLTNLLVNAFHAMPRGGTVHVEVGKANVKSPPKHAKRAPSYAVLRVRDEGTGIAPDHLPHIFDPFFTTKDVGTGTGLGLSVTFGIIRDHGGWIDVTTKLDQGTEFAIYLPQLPDDNLDR